MQNKLLSTGCATFLVLLFSAQFASAAAFTKTLCNPGTATISSPVQITDTASFTASINSFKGSTNLCTNDKLTMKINITIIPPGGYGTFTDESTCICPKSNPPDKSKDQKTLDGVGCAKGQTQPTVTFDISAHNTSCKSSTFTISKCATDPQAAFKAACAGQDMSVVAPTNAAPSATANPAGPAATAAPQVQPSPAPTQAPGSGSTIAGNDALVAALTKSGLSESDAKALAADPDSAQKLINAFATGDKDTIQDTVQDAASKAKLNLNDGVYDNIASLSATDVEQAKNTLAPLADSSGTYIASDTFVPDSSAPVYAPGKGGANAAMISQAEQQYGLPPGLLGNMCNAESRCNPSACFQNNPDSACGLYQYTTSTWTGVTTQMCAQGIASVSQYCVNGSIPLNYRLDATVATQVAGYNISQNLQQYGSLIAQTGIDQSTAAYIMNGLGTPTAAKFFQAYIANPNMSTADFLYQTQPSLAATILANNGHLYAGQTLQGTVNQFAANLGASASGSGANSSLGPFGAITGGGTYVDPTLTNYGAVSPFSNVGGLYTSSGITSTAGYTQTNPYATYTQSQTYSSSQNTQAQTGVQTTSATVTTAVPLAAAQLIVEPHDVSAGAQLRVVWTSAGTDVSAPCQVLENGTALMATAKEGSLILAATSTGTISFTLSCRSQATGASITSSDSATVH